MLDPFCVISIRSRGSFLSHIGDVTRIGHFCHRNQLFPSRVDTCYSRVTSVRKNHEKATRMSSVLTEKVSVESGQNCTYTNRQRILHIRVLIFLFHSRQNIGTCLQEKWVPFIFCFEEWNHNTVKHTTRTAEKYQLGENKCLFRFYARWPQQENLLRWGGQWSCPALHFSQSVRPIVILNPGEQSYKSCSFFNNKLGHNFLFLKMRKKLPCWSPPVHPTWWSTGSRRLSCPEKKNQNGSIFIAKVQGLHKLNLCTIGRCFFSICVGII